jgi:hypothetical protein
VRASFMSAAGMSAPVWAATALVGVRSCPLRRSPSRCLPLQQLEVHVGAVISSDGAAVERAAFAAAASTSALAAASLDALAAAAAAFAAARSRFSAAARSASCRRRVLEATEP